MKTRWFPRLGVVLVLFAMLMVPMAGAIEQAYACNPGRATSSGRYYDGWVRSPGSTVGGIYSQLANVDVFVQPGAYPTTAWVMLTNSALSQWAQLGWLTNSDGSRYTMLQVWNSSVDQVTRLTDPPQSLGSYPYYTVLYNNSPGYFTFQLNGAAWPYAGFQWTAPWTPTQGQASAEIRNFNSQMPGTTASAMGMYDTHLWFSGSWNTFSGSAASSSPSIWPYDGPYYGTTFYVWDSYC